MVNLRLDQENFVVVNQMFPFNIFKIALFLYSFIDLSVVNSTLWIASLLWVETISSCWLNNFDFCVMVALTFTIDVDVGHRASYSRSTLLDQYLFLYWSVLLLLSQLLLNLFLLQITSFITLRKTNSFLLNCLLKYTFSLSKRRLFHLILIHINPFIHIHLFIY